MTANQIAYQNMLETRRANRSKEEETKRANLAKEHETNRANVAKEYETTRSNVARETETHRANVVQESLGFANLAENTRAHKASEALTRASISETQRSHLVQEQLGWQQVSYQQGQLGETVRHNQAVEGTQQYSANTQRGQAIANGVIGLGNLAVNVYDAATGRKRTEYDLVTDLINAKVKSDRNALNFIGGLVPMIN